MSAASSSPLIWALDVEEFEMRRPLQISTHTFHTMRALVVTVERDGRIGRGEAQGVFYNGETAESMLSQAARLIERHGANLTRESLQSLLGPGGARNAIDCALWDLEAREFGGIWSMLGMSPHTVTTCNTVSLAADLDIAAKEAASMADFPLLKIKLSADRPVKRIEAIRKAAPDCRLIVDANTGWSFDQLCDWAPELQDLGVEMIEQPLARGADHALADYVSPVPLAADESLIDRTDLPAVSLRYAIANIKLDKAGGLTEALALAAEARDAGLDLMVGNFCGTSLAMAPSFIIAQMCRYCDLDGPLALVTDRANAMSFDGGRTPVFKPELWGG